MVVYINPYRSYGMKEDFHFIVLYRRSENKMRQLSYILSPEQGMSPVAPFTNMV